MLSVYRSRPRVVGLPPAGRAAVGEVGAEAAEAAAGVLHSLEYRTRFAADLKKMLPRIPLTK